MTDGDGDNLEKRTAMRVLLDSPSAWAQQSGADGGARRAAQVLSLLERAGVEVAEVRERGRKIGRGRMLWEGLRYMLEFDPGLPVSRQALGVCGVKRAWYAAARRREPSARVLVCESTRNPVALHLGKAYGMKVVAVPQNLESLAHDVVGQNEQDNPATYLREEAGWLKQADAVFCISREEQWLLRCLGVDADYLPYYPPAALMGDLLAVRAARRQSEKRRYLVLGSASNKQTFAGMTEQLEMLEEIRRGGLEIEVDVAGKDTETLAEANSGMAWAKFHGRVSQEKLAELLRGAKGLLVHQRWGAGALTRIPEVLIAGVPVIASTVACRSVFGMAGVYGYEGAGELAECLGRGLELPTIPAVPVQAEERFMECIRDA